LSRDVEAMAAEVVLLVKSALAPLQARLDALEQRHPFTRELEDHLRTTLGSLRERVAVVEVKAMQPGPTGEPGKDGKDGKDGADGKAGLTYQGVYQDGKSYELGDVVTWAGSTWHCNDATISKPGESTKGWTLMVKRGRDGKDGGAK
jgi:hypothetical protein